jgi:ClpP class serine protease
MTPEDKELCANLRRSIEGALETIATAAHINSERATSADAIDRLSAENAALRAQLEAAQKQEPVERQYQGRDGKWYPFMNPLHYRNTVDDGSWPIRDLYAAPIPADAKDAARYRLLRRGQQWSVINGIGDMLRSEVLDAAIDAAIKGKS